MTEYNSIDGTEKDLREYAWNYFQLHAAQRLTTFNFYIALSTLITTGLFASFHEGFQVPSLGIALGLLLMIFSFVFWKLEQRNRNLIWHAEEALKLLEEKIAAENTVTEHLKMFCNEERKTKIQKDSHGTLKNIWIYPYSYSNCFNIVFWVFALMGLFGALASVDSIGHFADFID
jgi:hypothetical protein